MSRAPRSYGTVAITVPPSPYERRLVIWDPDQPERAPQVLDVAPTDTRHTVRFPGVERGVADRLEYRLKTFGPVRGGFMHG